MALALVALVAAGCARHPAGTEPAATATPTATAPVAAGSTASPAPSLQPLPSFDLGDLTAVDKALSGASDALSAANDPGSEGGSR
jgi:PBP1b-binding outer membrane lipoprotein LpoB